MTLVPELFVRRLNKPKGLPINVRDVSVTGDGQTDDYAALNEAVRSAGATGTLYFPAGTYVVGTNLTIPACCIFAFGAKLKPSSGVTVTLSGPVEMAPGESVIASGTAGTVSITGTLESSGGVLDVRAFGAVGDGVTDDTAAIQRAFNAAGSNATVVFPPAVYRVTASCVWTGNNITLQGAGATLFADTNLIVPLAVSGTRVVVNGIGIDGNAKANRGIRVVAGSRDVSLVGCEVFDITQPGADTTQTAGIRCEDNVVGFSVRGCYIHDVSAPNSNVARGILVSNVTGAGVSRQISIIGNRIERITPVGDADGVVIQDWSDDVDAVLSDNVFVDCAKRAVKSQCPGVVVSGNTIRNLSATPYAGISVYASRHAVANNVLVGGNFENGIEVGAAGTAYSDITISGNVIRNDSAGTRGSSEGVRIFGTTVDRVSVVGNTVFFARGGLRFDCGLREASIVGNVVEDVSQSAINFAGASPNFADGVAVVGNTFLTVANYAVTGSASSANITVTGNHGGGVFGNVHAVLTGKAYSRGNSWDLDRLSANRGDASVTLISGANERIQQFQTALGANRTVTLSTSNAIAGDWFRIVRTGLGAFTLDVGGLKTIPSATAAFVEVVFDGSAWRLTGYGLL